LRAVEIDPETRTARAQAGALWMDVTGPAHEHGLAALAGSSPDVGVVGYTLGGGLSRTYGVAANSVTAIEVVAADGQVIRTDPDNDPALFWALRGGGGSFGIVTAIEFTLYPVSEVYAGVMFWPIRSRCRGAARVARPRALAAGGDDDRRPAADAAADP
jgi:FAD/FMN-containing dehydrogenase